MKTFLYLFLVLFLAACNSAEKKETRNNVQQEITPPKENPDGVLLFDGETMEGWEITNFGTQGPVKISEGNLILNYGDGLTGITYSGNFPVNNYEVDLEAQKITGNDFFCGITFPVDSTFCSFIVGGWGGPVVGLSTIDGADASENETKILKNFEKDRWYKIRLQVNDGKISAWIDDENVVDFVVGEHKIGIRPEVGLSTPFGIATWNTTGALKNIRLKKL